MRTSWVVGIALIQVALLPSCESGKQPIQGKAPTEAAAGKPVDAKPAPAPARTATGGSGNPASGIATPGATATAAVPGSAAEQPAPTVPLTAQVIAAAAHVTTGPIEALFPVRYERNETLSDKMQRRIRFRLRTVTKAPIALRDIIHVPHDDGSADVFALYEYSAYEECVQGYASRKEARDRCLGAAEDRNRLRLNRECVVLGVVHAAFAVPGPNDASEAGGDVTVTSAALPGTRCNVGEHKHTFVADLDHDGSLDLYAEFFTSERFGGERRSPGAEPTFYESVQREVVIFSGNKNAGPPLMMGNLESDGMGGNANPDEPLIALHDLDGDGHLDVIETAPCWSGMPCEPEHRERTIYLYAARLGRWLKAVEPTDATAGAGAGSAPPAAAAKRAPAP